MRKEKIFEVFLTNDFVNEETWLKFILYISRLNGIFIAWKIYVKFEKNNVRYFIKTRYANNAYRFKRFFASEN